MPDISSTEGRIMLTLASVNEALDGIRYEYAAPEAPHVNLGKIEKHDAHGSIGYVAVGQPKECWQFAQGLREALDVTNRLGENAAPIPSWNEKAHAWEI